MFFFCFFFELEMPTLLFLFHRDIRFYECKSRWIMTEYSDVLWGIPCHEEQRRVEEHSADLQGVSDGSGLIYCVKSWGGRPEWCMFRWLYRLLLVWCVLIHMLDHYWATIESLLMGWKCCSIKWLKQTENGHHVGRITSVGKLPAYIRICIQPGRYEFRSLQGKLSNGLRRCVYLIQQIFYVGMS